MSDMGFRGRGGRGRMLPPRGDGPDGGFSRGGMRGGFRGGPRGGGPPGGGFAGQKRGPSDNFGPGGFKKRTVLPDVYRFIVSADRVQHIIGKGGENIKAVKEEAQSLGYETKVSIYAQRSNGEPLMEGAVDRVMSIQTGDMMGLKQALTSLLPSLQRPYGPQGKKLEIRCIVPGRTCSCIIGKGGEIVKGIKEQTGSFIQVYSQALPFSDEKVVRIQNFDDGKLIQAVCDVFNNISEAKSEEPIMFYDPLGFAPGEFGDTGSYVDSDMFQEALRSGAPPPGTPGFCGPPPQRRGPPGGPRMGGPPGGPRMGGPPGGPRMGGPPGGPRMGGGPPGPMGHGPGPNGPPGQTGYGPDPSGPQGYMGPGPNGPPGAGGQPTGPGGPPPGPSGPPMGGPPGSAPGMNGLPPAASTYSQDSYGQGYDQGNSYNQGYYGAPQQSSYSQVGQGVPPPSGTVPAAPNTSQYGQAQGSYDTSYSQASTGQGYPASSYSATDPSYGAATSVYGSSQGWDNSAPVSSAPVPSNAPTQGTAAPSSAYNYNYPQDYSQYGSYAQYGPGAANAPPSTAQYGWGY